jgi:phospholipid/cholesterol/gamma-HCH transport system substrate-binding protein
MSKTNNNFEVIIGTFVLVAAAFFMFFSANIAGLGTKEGYNILAKFDNIDGITIGTDVKISGVKIGTVEDQYLDKDDFRATLKLKINDGVKVPADSSAKISSEGLLGSKYLAIFPGGDIENLNEGEEIIFTQSSVNLEDLLGKFIFSSNSDKNSEDDKDED